MSKYLRDYLTELRQRTARLSSNRESDWGSEDHVSDLESRVKDAEYWRDTYPRGSEKRSYYKNIVSHLKRELQSARKKNQKQLSEGGLVGHLMHLYDNRDLTFREIKMILRKASTGRLENVSEKMDGMNLVFSFNLEENAVKVTRGSDIRGGGMDAAALAAKFAGRGSVEAAFNNAFDVLSRALTSLPGKVKERVFGPAANRWYSMEIIYTENPNVINYDSNSIVFHGWPVFNRDESGNVQMTEDTVGGIDILTKHIETMQKAVASRGWRVSGPGIVRMQKLSNGDVFEDALAAIDATVEMVGLGPSDTVGEFLRVKLIEDLDTLGLNDDLRDAVVSRCLKTEDAPSLNDIKKMSNKSQYDAISEFVKRSPALLGNYIRPIEIAINDFAVELLKGLESTLIDNTEREVERLRGEVRNAITAIESSGDETAMTILARQLEKLKSVENVTSPVEGVVFIYKGNAYKFTGSFAAANQILGLFKYGRKGTKL